jgi:hypothetical protein
VPLGDTCRIRDRKGTWRPYNRCRVAVAWRLGRLGHLSAPPAPEAFAIGGIGVTGDIGGMLSLVALHVAVGWTVTVLIADSLPIRRNKVCDTYDHLWLVLGLVAAVFFIADSQMSQHDANFRETGTDVQRASGYLLKQVEAYISWCQQNAADHAAPCSWRRTCIPSYSTLNSNTRSCSSKWVLTRRRPCMEIRVAPRHPQKWTRSAEKSQPIIKDFVRWRI